VPREEQVTKLQLRGELAAQWKAYLVPEADGAWNMLTSPQTVAALGKVLARLSGNKEQQLKPSKM